MTFNHPGRSKRIRIRTVPFALGGIISGVVGLLKLQLNQIYVYCVSRSQKIVQNISQDSDYLKQSRDLKNLFLSEFQRKRHFGPPFHSDLQ
jgi:hypothetical protein